MIAFQVARQDVGRVADRLAAPELEVGAGEVERGRSELGDSCLERDARPRRGLHEDQPDCAPRQDVGGVPACPRGLQFVRKVENLLQIRARPGPDRREVAAFQAGGDLDHAGIVLGR